MVLLDPRRVLRRGEGEAVLRVEVEQVQLVGDGAGRLAPRLAQRPQPGGVDVRVADRRQRVRRGRGGAGEDVGELPERGDVGGNLPHLLVHDDEVGPAQRVQRRGACRRLLAELRLDERGIAEHDGVRGSLEVELEPAVGTRFDGDPLVPGVVRLDDAAVGPEDEALALEAGGVVLAAEVDQGLELLTAMRLGDGSAEAHPGGAPGGPPRSAYPTAKGCRRSAPWHGCPSRNSNCPTPPRWSGALSARHLSGRHRPGSSQSHTAGTAWLHCPAPAAGSRFAAPVLTPATPPPDRPARPEAYPDCSRREPYRSSSIA